MRKPRESFERKRGYNVKMIRDFLGHLEWELRIKHFENTAKPGTINPELVDMLSKYQKKWHCVGLMTADAVDTEGASEEETRLVLERWRQFLANITESQLEMFTSLKPLFEEALMCADNSGGFVCIKRKLSDIVRILDEIDSGESEDEQ